MNTIEQCARTARAFLRGGSDKAVMELRTEDRPTAYTAVMVALLRQALTPQFPGGLTNADVIGWVASVRGNQLGQPDRLNPELAEDTVRIAFGHSSTVTGHSVETRAKALLILLMSAVERLKLDDKALDDLIANACQDAEAWIAQGFVPAPPSFP